MGYEQANKWLAFIILDKGDDLMRLYCIAFVIQVCM